MQKFNPGDVAPETAFYRVVDQNGKTLDKVSVSKGDRLPPTQRKDYYYELDYWSTVCINMQTHIYQNKSVIFE